MGTLAVYVLPLQAESGDDNGNPLLEASPGLMIWTLVIFGITLFILKRYVFGPVGQAIEKRRADISQSIEEAERSRDEATALLEDYRTRLAEARREADALREQGRKEGERQAQEIVTQAHAQRERILADAETQISAEARSAASGLRDQVATLALLAAEKVSRRSLSDDDHRRLIEEAIAEADLSAVATNGNGRTRLRVSVATTYADALYEAAVDADAVPQVAADVNAFAEAVEGSPELRMALDNPEIDSRAKTSVIAAVAADAHPLVGNFLQVLVERGRIAEFLEIAQAFRERVARAQARIEVEAVTAVPLPDDLRDRIVESIQSKTHATVELTESVNPDVVGGLVLHVGEVVIDGSVRHRIEELRHDLTRAPVDAAVAPA